MSETNNQSPDFSDTDLVDETAFTELDVTFLQALRAASTNVRLRKLTQVDIVDIKPVGHDKRNDEKWDELKEGKASPKWTP